MSSIVVGVIRDFDQEKFLEFIREHYVNKERIICFSHLCGRKDLIGLIKILKDEGFRTILGGPRSSGLHGRQIRTNILFDLKG